MKHMVFDIGGVLIDWDPALAWADDLGEAGARAFLDRVQFDKLNFACDAGVTFADAAKELDDPNDAKLLAEYVERYTKSVHSKIQGTWDILYALKEKGVRIFAITNWSAETWPEGCKAHPELAEVFEAKIVSGEAGLVKPSIEIYRAFCAKAGVDAQDCIFTDDGLHNCLGAKAAGMDAIHFTGPDALSEGLSLRGLL